MLLALVAGTLAACSAGDETPATGGVSETDPQLLFWDGLLKLCGQAFEGRVVESVPPDPSFEGRALIMHVRSCDPGEIRIPFHVGEDRSRTWIVTTTSVGLRLKHDHRHEDGSGDEVTLYGGDTRGRGSPEVQDFPADAFTAGLVPAAASNTWTLELHPGRSFVYALSRGGTERRFRVEFDLSRPVDPPPAPWGG
jgi:hypothetical protein